MPEPDPTVETGKTKGAMAVRGFRYLSCIGIGYLLGVMAGASFPDPGPSLFVVAFVCLLVLWLVFRKGQQSNSHAAIDAVLSANANARAAAQAVASQQVNIAGGHLVQAPQEYHPSFPAVTPAPSRHEVVQQSPDVLPPVETYESDVWVEEAEDLASEAYHRRTGL